MPSPLSGKAGSPVAPADPTKALEADVADPGEVGKLKAEQRQSKTGKYGAVAAKPYKPGDSESEGAADEREGSEDGKSKTWIEIELVDKTGHPVAGETYQVTLADGKITKGTLNEKGFARLEPVEPGTCKITFPNLEKQAWKPL